MLLIAGMRTRVFVHGMTIGTATATENMVDWLSQNRFVNFVERSQRMKHTDTVKEENVDPQ